MSRLETLVLTGDDVRAELGFAACIPAVEEAFRQHGDGSAPAPSVLGVHVPEGGFHIKAGLLHLEKSYFVAKANANFPGNGARHGLPTIQGVALLFDADCGRLLALIDSGEITRIRTAAASAVAARHLARPGPARVTICGCGVQGEAHALALRHVCEIDRVFAYDPVPGRAARFAEQVGKALGVVVIATDDLPQATRASSIVVTCTPARAPVLSLGDIAPGTFIAAVGADHPEKHEIDPALMAAATIVTDVTEQAATMGDLHHAIDAGLLDRSAVHAELGQIVAGRRPGRRSYDEIIVFDSTGMALQDVAAAAMVYERAVSSGRGLRIALAS